MSEDIRNSLKEDLQKAKRFIKNLRDRGLIADITSEEDLESALVQNKRVYFGIDPTADFLHLGHYLPLTLIQRFLLAGYRAIIVIGGVTAQIGDPSFRSRDRIYNFDARENSWKLARFINDFFDGFLKAKQISLDSLYISNNLDFLEGHLRDRCERKRDAIIWFLKDICRHIKVSELIHQDFIKERLENGLTLSEFLYPSLQAFDFLYLSENHDVAIQIGGSDQWTNILAGKDLIDRKGKGEIKPVGFTFPILADSSGNKFGKSDGNAIEIFGSKSKNPKFLSFRLYQYLINLDDALVIDYAKMLTFVDLDSLKEWEESKLLAKRNFAYEVCKDIYGSDSADHSRSVSSKIFSTNVHDLNFIDVLTIAFSVDNTIICDSRDEIYLRDICIRARLVSSGSEFQRVSKSKGIKVFSRREGDVAPDDVFGFEDCIKPFVPGNDSSFGFLMVKKGQKSFSFVLFIGEDLRLRPDNLLLN